MINAEFTLYRNYFDIQVSSLVLRVGGAIIDIDVPLPAGTACGKGQR